MTLYLWNPGNEKPEIVEKVTALVTGMDGSLHWWVADSPAGYNAHDCWDKVELKP